MGADVRKYVNCNHTFLATCCTCKNFGTQDKKVCINIFLYHFTFFISKNLNNVVDIQNAYLSCQLHAQDVRKYVISNISIYISKILEHKIRRCVYIFFCIILFFLFRKIWILWLWTFKMPTSVRDFFYFIFEYCGHSKCLL